MNKKLRATIQRSVELFAEAERMIMHLSPGGMNYAPAGALFQKLGTHRDVLVRVLNPPVRFAWSHVRGPNMVPRYVADFSGDAAGKGFVYIVERAPEHGRGMWRASATNRFGRTSHALNGLPAAKQWCVDHGVREATARREARTA